MTQTTIDLGPSESSFVEIYKAKNGIKSKSDAVRKIIEEFRDLKNEEFNDRFLAFESLIMSEKALAKNWLSKEDEEAFAYLQ